ncbi:hypothetical protein [Arthrobacter sp.]|uniref:hypothetical protein n=1 Tax=Arthrobacter sp. TaxID=1667 RepID=UPI0026DF0C46|nr:hypothetical protein [Arthrobacter sp.]MDO5752287.1 hypothetical protein [Arthrobacter sp.]
MSDSGRPFDFGQFGGAGTPSKPHASAGLTAPPSTNPFAGISGTNENIGFDLSDGNAGVPGSSFNTGSAGEPLRPTGAPVIWLLGSMAAAVIALVLALGFGGVPALTVAAWVLAGPVAIALVAVYSFRDTKARTAALYSSSGSATWLYRVAIMLSLVAVVVSALRIADWVGRI